MQLDVDHDQARQNYLHPMSSSVTMPLSTMVKPPTPGNTMFFKISVPSAVTLIRHSWAASSNAWPCSPHNLIHIKTRISYKRLSSQKQSVTWFVDRISYSYLIIQATARAMTFSSRYFTCSGFKMLPNVSKVAECVNCSITYCLLLFCVTLRFEVIFTSNFHFYVSVLPDSHCVQGEFLWILLNVWLCQT